MKYMNTLLATLCIALLATSCSKELDSEATTTTDAAQLIKIDAFPAFGEATQTRAIGAQDAGKKAWTNGDEVLLKIQLKDDDNNNDGAATTHTLTYNGTIWAASPALGFISDYQKTDITAYYAPAYEWNTAGSLALKSGKLAGTDEYLVYNSNGITLASGISINFSGTRTYSRLRIAAKAGTKLSVAMPALTLASTTAAMGEDKPITLTTGNDGNAYLYGSWTAGATLTVKDVPAESTSATVITTKTLAAVNAAGRSYALAAYTNYDDRGTGTETAPYEIYTAKQLQSMNTATADGDNKIFARQYIKLMSDIDCNGFGTFTPIGSNSAMFAGNFDGDNHTISNLTIGKKDYQSSLFGYVYNATIHNLTLLDPTSQTDAIHAGALVGYSVGTTKISDCHVKVTSGSTATITSSSNIFELNVGGLIGSTFETTTLLRCSSDISVSCTNANAGGLVGYNYSDLTLAGCRATGATNGENAGGLLGRNANKNLIIVGSYATGKVTGTKSAGGLVGLVDGVSNDIKILSSYATGEPSTATDIGSLVGKAGTYYTFNLYYVGSTTHMGNAVNGVGRDDLASLTIAGVELGKSAGELRAVIVNADAEAKWSETGFATLKTLLDGKTLSQIWKDNGSAAPTLWWEQ